MTDKASKTKRFDKILNWLLIAMLCYYGYRYFGLMFPSTLVAKPSQAQAVMYSTKWCPFCIEARGYFAQKGIKYFEYDINESAVGRAQYEKLGGRGVPLIVIGKHKIYGMQRAKIQAALASLKATPTLNKAANP